ncbi:D-alanine--D-alanine ligase [Myxococcota bacterium]|nr:D-alanine--D-alanine ligase [Myxococcota bacterium]
MSQTQAEPRIAVFSGGLSGEHDISLNSGKKVMAALAARQPTSVVIERDGRWVVDGAPQSSPAAAIDLVKTKADVAFLALHGPFGEDGTIQGFLEVNGVPYTGSGVMASALAMDKPRTKMVYRHHGLATPEFVVASRGSWRRERASIVESVAGRCGFPCVVKPARLGSSVGISFPKDRASLEAAIDDLLRSTDDVIVERFVRGRELTCGILAIDREDRTFALPPTEIVPGDQYEFFDYVAKYTPGATAEITPARISAEATKEVQRQALVAHEALGCRDFSRSDFILTDAGPMILETNTIPGLTETSLLPQGAAAIGIDYATLIGIAVDNAWLRRR